MSNINANVQNIHLCNIKYCKRNNSDISKVVVRIIENKPLRENCNQYIIFHIFFYYIKEKSPISMHDDLNNVFNAEYFKQGNTWRL